MPKIIAFASIVFLVSLVFACGTDPTTTAAAEERAAYRLLVEAEELSGMADWNGRLITADGPLGLPTAYEGVEIAYASRTPEIISDAGVVTLPDVCWIRSKDQQGAIDFPNLNDNWPVVVDVTMTYRGQTRTAKLMFVVTPRPGFTCDNYLGD